MSFGSTEMPRFYKRNAEPSWLEAVTSPTHCPKNGGSRIYCGKEKKKKKYLSVVAKKGNQRKEMEWFTFTHKFIETEHWTKVLETLKRLWV